MNLRQLHNGFTLLELLVVLAIVGALGALVGPNMWNSYQRSNERHLVFSFANELMALRRQAHFSGESLHIPENTLLLVRADSQLPRLPDGWLVESQTKIYFLPSGVTNGSAILLNSPTGRVWELLIRPLDGQIAINSQ